MRDARHSLTAKSASFVCRLRGHHLLILNVVVGLSIYITLATRLNRQMTPMEVAAYLPGGLPSRSSFGPD
jgi:hypothetical protein